MLKFNEKTIEILRHNAKYLILSDPLIRNLFDCVVISAKDEIPPFAGNFFIYLDTKTDDFIDELFEESEDMTIEETTAILRQRLVEELIDLIQAEIEY